METFRTFTKQLNPQWNITKQKIREKIPAFVSRHERGRSRQRGVDELEKYVKQYKHLPLIPSEIEMKQNSVDVMELNVKLLQKVEELTLYIIELNKKVKELESKN